MQLHSPNLILQSVPRDCPHHSPSPVSCKRLTRSSAKRCASAGSFRVGLANPEAPVLSLTFPSFSTSLAEPKIATAAPGGFRGRRPGRSNPPSPSPSAFGAGFTKSVGEGSSSTCLITVCVATGGPELLLYWGRVSAGFQESDSLVLWQARG